MCLPVPNRHPYADSVEPDQSIMLQSAYFLFFPNLQSMNFVPLFIAVINQTELISIELTFKGES